MYEKKSSLDLDPRSKLTCSATFVSRIEFQGSNADTSLLVHIILLLGNSYNISRGITLQLMMSIFEHINLYYSRSNFKKRSCTTIFYKYREIG